MARQYQYIKIDSRFFCLQQNPVVLAWLLYFKQDPFRPISRYVPKKFFDLRVASLRRNFQRFLVILKIIVFFVRCRLKMRKADSMVELPLFGHVCISVHKGYKIFNFRKKTVTKIFDKGIDTSNILSEIQRLKKISQIEFAPSIRRWNIEERWYEEDYFNGFLEYSYEPLDSTALCKQFYHSIVPHLDMLTFFQQPKTKIAIEYINEIIGILEVNKSSRNELEIRNVQKVKKFIHSIVKKLRVEGDNPVYFVTSHGDFCPANMLNTKRGLKIIDWESVTYRSALFDFYSYFFFRPVSNKIPVDTLVLEIDDALPFFISTLALKAPDISKSLLSLEKVYRWIYYIERVCMLVEREITDNNLDIVNYIFRYIEAFNSYEDVLAGRLPEKNIGKPCLSRSY